MLDLYVKKLYINIYGKYKDNWYAPTVAEMYQIYRNYTSATNSIKDILPLVGGDSFIEIVPGTPNDKMPYMTSTPSTDTEEGLYLFQIGIGAMPCLYKHISAPACFIREF